MDCQDILTNIIGNITEVDDFYRIALAARVMSIVVRRSDSFFMSHIMSELRPYVLRTTLRGNAVSRFTLLNHGAMDRIEVRNMPFTGYDSDFHYGVRSVFMTDEGAGSWMERRTYVESNFQRVDSLDAADLEAAIEDLTAIVAATGPPSNSKLIAIESASHILHAFQLVRRARLNANVLNPEHDLEVSRIKGLLSHLRSLRQPCRRSCPISV